MSNVGRKRQRRTGFSNSGRLGYQGDVSLMTGGVVSDESAHEPEGCEEDEQYEDPQKDSSRHMGGDEVGEGGDLDAALPLEDPSTLSQEDLLVAIKSFLAGNTSGDALWDIAVIQDFEKRVGFDTIDTKIKDAVAPGSALRAFVEGKTTYAQRTPAAVALVGVPAACARAKALLLSPVTLLGVVGTVVARRMFPRHPVLAFAPAALAVGYEIVGRKKSP